MLILITGTSHGIGKAISEMFLKEENNYVIKNMTFMVKT